jgi:uncharacterized delta-60 repeat protein
MKYNSILSVGSRPIILKRILSAFLLLLFLQPHISRAQAGILDPSFGAGAGFVTTSFGFTGGSAHKVLPLPDGRVLAIGISSLSTTSSGPPNYVRSYQDVFDIARYNANGSLDPSFGTNGKKQIAEGHTTDYYYPTAALQPDGKIILSGMFLNPDSNYDMLLVRLDSTGFIDYSFGDSGRVVSDYHHHHSWSSDIALQPDGKVVQIGSTITSHGSYVFLARYQTDGRPDSTFGDNGIVDSTIKFNSDFYMHLLPSGKILVAGQDSIIRLNQDGSLDRSFHINYPPALYHSLMATFYIDVSADGHIVIAGDSNLRFTKSILVKTDSNGVIDTTFANRGYTHYHLAKYCQPSGVFAMPDGSVLMLMYLNYNSYALPTSSIAVVRYRPDGRIDSTFGTNGTFVFDTAQYKDQIAYSMALDRDGKILLAGRTQAISGSQNEFTVWRLLNQLNTGVLDFNGDKNAMLVYPNPISHEATLTYSLNQSGNVSISLYDMTGREVKQITDNEFKPVGTYHQHITLPDQIATGTYTLRIGNGSGTSSIRVTIM